MALHRQTHDAARTSTARRALRTRTTRRRSRLRGRRRAVVCEAQFAGKYGVAHALTTSCSGWARAPARPGHEEHQEILALAIRLPTRRRSRSLSSRRRRRAHRCVPRVVGRTGRDPPRFRGGPLRGEPQDKRTAALRVAVVCFMLILIPGERPKNGKHRAPRLQEAAARAGGDWPNPAFPPASARLKCAARSRARRFIVVRKQQQQRRRKRAREQSTSPSSS